MLKSYFNTILLLGFFAVLIVGILIYWRKKEVAVNRVWFLASVSASLWSLFYFLTINAPNKEIAIILIKIVHTLGLIVVVLWFYFVTVFLEINKKGENKKIFILLTLGSVEAFILNFSPWFMKDMVPKQFFNY